MAALTIGKGHWRALPFPLRIAAGVLAFILVIWLAKWLGSASVLLAIGIWLVVLTALLHASGRLGWLDRYATVGRLLARYAPSIGAAGAPPSGSHNAAKPSAADASARPDVPETKHFVGIDKVREEIASLIDSRSVLNSTLAPATMVFLIGPRGTGKSSLALTMADDLYQATVVKSDRIIILSETGLPGLGDSYGPSAEVLNDLTTLVQSALDGVLLIEDLDRLVSLAQGAVAQETGSRVLDVARRYPGRLFVLCTGSPEAFAALDPARRWLGQLNVRKIGFSALADSDLQAIFLQSLSSQGYGIEPEAERALALRLRELRQEGGEAFDNAHAARRLVDAVLHNHGLRLRLRPNSASADGRVIAATDVRNALVSV
jgi:energy-coupling factor transporter ATP-binding protein EcfA2